MNILFRLLYILVPALAIAIKYRIVNAQNGKKPTWNEFIIDSWKLLILTSITILGNIFGIHSKSMLPILIDICMLITYIIHLLNKKYDYSYRKAYSSLVASIFIFTICIVVISQMILGKYNTNNYTLATCFFKCVVYFFVFIYCSLTAGTTGIRRKIFVLVDNIKLSFQNYKMSKLDYFTFAFLTLFIFNGCNGYNPQIPIFGIQEIINKKYTRGFLFIGIGVFITILSKFYPQISSLLTVLYDLIALMYLMFMFINKKTSYQ